MNKYVLLTFPSKSNDEENEFWDSKF